MYLNNIRNPREGGKMGTRWQTLHPPQPHVPSITENKYICTFLNYHFKKGGKLLLHEKLKRNLKIKGM